MLGGIQLDLPTLHVPPSKKEEVVNKREMDNKRGCNDGVYHREGAYYRGGIWISIMVRRVHDPHALFRVSKNDFLSAQMCGCRYLSEKYLIALQVTQDDSSLL